MKRLAALLFSLFFLTGCSIKEYTPVIPDEINQLATVTTGDFSYKCEICRTKDSVKVKALTTNAAGLVMKYNGADLELEYEGMSYSIPALNYEKTNPAIIIYDVFSALADIPNESISRLDDGYRYKGKISLGEFILVQDDADKVKTLTLKNSDITFSFE